MASVRGSAARKKTFFWLAKSLTARPILDRKVPASIATFSPDTSSLAAVCASAGLPPSSLETTTSFLPLMPPPALISFGELPSFAIRLGKGGQQRVAVNFADLDLAFRHGGIRHTGKCDCQARSQEMSSLHP